MGDDNRGDLGKINWKGPQPAPRYLGRLLRANFPQITQTGIYNDRLIAGTNKKSAHAEGRAIDIHLKASDPNERWLGDELVKALIKKASALGIDNVIWNRRIWSQSHGGPHTYHGVSAHTDHIHVEFTRTGSQNQVLKEILIDIGILRTGIEDLNRATANLA